LDFRTCGELSRTIADFGLTEEFMLSKFRTGFPVARSDNLKSQIQNRKWVGMIALAVTFTMCGEVAMAQQTGKVPRIGFLDESTASGMAGLLEAFRQELSKLGWIEGKNIIIEYRFAEQMNERLPELTADLVRLKVDLIVAAGTVAALASKNATTTIPIVMSNAGDP
jgi:putative ABC transport system substrate-binding protein